MTTVEFNSRREKQLSQHVLLARHSTQLHTFHEFPLNLHDALLLLLFLILQMRHQRLSNLPKARKQQR